MDLDAGVVGVGPDAGAVAALAGGVGEAVGGRVVQDLVERGRRVEDLALGAAVGGLEGGEARLEGGVVVGDVALELRQLGLVLLGEGGGVVEG